MRTHYFNSGVMLLRPDEDEYQRLVLAMNSAPDNGEFAEQDFLNIFYHGRITHLDPSFNRQVCSNSDCLNDMTPTDEAFTDNTRIMHFSGNNKPWNMQNCVTQRIVQLESPLDPLRDKPTPPLPTPRLDGAHPTPHHTLRPGLELADRLAGNYDLH